ncbi:hypothetical protein C4097_06420 [Clostridioides difficile]|uniref:hypothetical protein n=1 Tax=Clostridioides sp. ZZV15-6598 TaxID=2811501 RepID=UPI001D11BE29|nr:hypothetical protein [Clostridioides sp. ZZV15-6598]MDB3084194.1 hypothetical protein [Clostridioides difficile]
MSKNNSEVKKTKLVYIDPQIHSLLKAEAMINNASIKETLENIVRNSVSDMAKMIVNGSPSKTNNQNKVSNEDDKKGIESSSESIGELEKEPKIEDEIIEDIPEDVSNEDDKKGYESSSIEELEKEPESEKKNEIVEDISEDVLNIYRR